MSKVILFAGKDFPFSREFASGAALGGRKVFLASDEYSEEEKIPTGSRIDLKDKRKIKFFIVNFRLNSCTFDKVSV